MGGNPKISSRATNVKKLFITLEKNAKKIKKCWFCGFPLSSTPTASAWNLTGNHKPDCPFELLAVAVEELWIIRDDGQRLKQAAEGALSARVDELLAEVTKVPRCPIPSCDSSLKHELHCPFHSLTR